MSWLLGGQEGTQRSILDCLRIIRPKITFAQQLTSPQRPAPWPGARQTSPVTVTVEQEAWENKLHRKNTKRKSNENSWESVEKQVSQYWT